MTESFRTVSSGYKLVYAGFLLQVLAVIILFGFLVAARGGMAGGALRALVGVLYAYIVLTLLGQVVGLLGRFKCMAVPREVGSGPKQMIVFSVAMGLVALLLGVLELANLLGERFLPEEVSEVLTPAAAVMSLVAVALFLSFTKAAAVFVGRPDLAVDAGSVLTLGVLLVALILVGQFLVRGGGPNVGAGIVGLATIVFAIMFALRYAGLLLAMSAATLEYAGRAVYDYEGEPKPADGERTDFEGERDQW